MKHKPKPKTKKIWVNLDGQPVTGEWDCPAKVLKQITVKIKTNEK